MYFHEERPRNFRYNSDKYNSEWESQKNSVYRIRCKTAKKAGNQYTLTIIPHFLLPGCLVRADDVFNAGMDKAIREDIEKVCLSMGVLDKRTARKHLARFDACLNDFVISLAAIISGLGEDLPDKKPEMSGFEVNINWLRELTPRIISIRGKLFGFENLSLEEIAAQFNFFNHPAYSASTCVNTGHEIFSFFLRSPP